MHKIINRAICCQLHKCITRFLHLRRRSPPRIQGGGVNSSTTGSKPNQYPTFPIIYNDFYIRRRRCTPAESPSAPTQRACASLPGEPTTSAPRHYISGILTTLPSISADHSVHTISAGLNLHTTQRPPPLPPPPPSQLQTLAANYPCSGCMAVFAACRRLNG
jgi:hypothetical protein